MSTQSALITVMVRAARKAARGLVRDFGEVEQLQVSRKGPADFVSNADLKAEKTLREELERARPDFGFLMEESGAAKSGDGRHRFIVDPLDGTTNFLHGLPHYAISIGAERDGELIAGVVYEPTHDEMFWAEKGQGAHLNDRRLRVSAREQMRDAVIATGIPFMGKGSDPGHRRYLAQMSAVMGQVAGIRRWGTASLDLAYVAAGRFDGFWEMHLSPWDMAAGIVLVREAGGFVSEVDGGNRMLDSGAILASNDRLHQELSQILRQAKPV
ncbi:MAG: inositol monophosphatase [Alphaproteobacteria bacterium]|nr:inositol monophosphatase [Alphaproteobacteria bacterium]